MTQFKKRIHRAKRRLNAASPSFQWFFLACEKVRKDEKDWDSCYFVTADGVEREALNEMSKTKGFADFNNLPSSEKKEIFLSGLMWSTWRMTQGIYRFDEVIYKSLLSTKKQEKIPTQLLKRLPQWCVYIETQGLFCDFGFGDCQLHGVWCQITSIENKDFLMLFVDIDEAYSDYSLPPSVCIDISHKEIGTAINVIKDQKINDALIKKTERWIVPVFNLLLYLCSEEPDLANKNKPLNPENPEPKKTKKGWRIFPRHGIQMWDVGTRLAQSISSFYQQSSESEATGLKVRPHVRNAHWRTVLFGKMKDAKGNKIKKENRQRKLIWIPPSFINVNKIDELPAVIRKIEK